MKILNANEYGKLTKEHLSSFEKSSGRALPADYREFLLSYNGGSPEPSCFRIEEDVSSIQVFFGIHEGPDWCRLEEAVSVFGDRIPNSLCPIARDPGGNILCVGTGGPESGRVYFWDHELGTTFELAKSLPTFLDQLFDWELPGQSKIEVAIKKDDVSALAALLGEQSELDRKDEDGWSMMELAAISNSVSVIQFLHEKGAKLGRALELAEKNFEFFPKHAASVELIKKLMGS